MVDDRKVASWAWQKVGQWSETCLIPMAQVVEERRRPAWFNFEEPKQTERLREPHHETRLWRGGRQPHHHDARRHHCICHHIFAFSLTRTTIKYQTKPILTSLTLNVLALHRYSVSISTLKLSHFQNLFKIWDLNWNHQYLISIKHPKDRSKLKFRTRLSAKAFKLVYIQNAEGPR